MKHLLFTIKLLLMLGTIQAQNIGDTLKITDKLMLIKITDHAYIHLSYLQGKIPCNGLLFTEKNKAFLFDTPSYDSTTLQLISYIRDSMKLNITGFSTNDWHIDSQGGLGVIAKSKIKSYAHEMTRQIAKQHGLPVAKFGFKDSLKIRLGNKVIEFFYLGAAHTLDNIVAWIPSDKILFADCLIKEMTAKDLGFTADGDIKAYPETLQKISDKFPHALHVIPGHGKYGGIELIRHTQNLARKYNQ